MSILTALRAGIKVADKIVKPLEPTVQYERMTSMDTNGKRTFGNGAVPLRAIVDFKRVQVRGRDGQVTMTRSTLELLDINAVVAATGGLGISVNDKFTLPDGTSGPTLDVGGFVDAGTGHPIATTVMLG